MTKKSIAGWLFLVAASAGAQQIGKHSTLASDVPLGPQFVMEAETFAPQSLTPVPNSGGGMTIHPTFDTSITGNVNSAAIMAAINQACAIYAARFKDPITVEIYFRFATTEADGVSPMGGALAQSQFGFYFKTWVQYVSALQADSKTATDVAAIASLPLSALNAQVNVKPPNGRAIGMSTAGFVSSTGGSGGTFDGVVTLNSGDPFQFTRPTASNKFDAMSSLEHEMDEVLGLGCLITNTGVFPQDIFTYSAAGVHNLTAIGTRYFSTDNGTTNLVNENDPSNGGDAGDWASESCPQTHPFVQNAFGCPGPGRDVTAGSPEAVALDAIGFDLVTGVAKSDFDSNSKSDILLEDTSTNIAMWLMNGGTIASGALVATPGAGWKAIGTGDFDNDGKADIVLQNSTTGDVAAWIMNGTTITSGAVLGSPGTAFKVVAAGDFDGDGKADILLQNNVTGDIAEWKMNGAAIASGVLVASPGVAWKVMGAADFSGDGKADILLQNSTTGDVAIWIMSGSTVTTGVLLGSPGTVFSAVAAGDLNGDGKADIILQNTTTHDVAVWLLNGSAITGGAVIGSPGATWSVITSADYNGDGNADILLRDSATGTVAEWQMSGTTLTAGVAIGSPGVAFTPVGR